MRQKGQPTKLTRELLDKVTLAVRAGTHPVVAARYRGISTSAHYYYMQEGEKQRAARDAEDARFHEERDDEQETDVFDLPVGTVPITVAGETFYIPPTENTAQKQAELINRTAKHSEAYLYRGRLRFRAKTQVVERKDVPQKIVKEKSGLPACILRPHEVTEKVTFLDYLEGIERAEAENEVRLVAALQQSPQWQAKALLLERRYRQRWGRQVEFGAIGGGPLKFTVDLSKDESEELAIEEEQKARELAGGDGAGLTEGQQEGTKDAVE